MRTLRGRFIRTNIWMAVFSAIWMLFATLLLLFAFSVSIDGGLPALISGVKEIIYGKALGHDGGSLVWYPVLWAIIISILILITCIALTANLSKAVLVPIKDLKKAVEKIAKGDLNFDVMSCDDREMKELCDSFEEIRKRLKSNVEKELRQEGERSMLIANISHDMRTPITTIKGYLEGIHDGVADSPEKLEKYLSTIYAKTQVLENMVDSMTEYSELELGRMQYTFEFVDLSAYLKDLAEEYRLDVEEKGLKFHIELPSIPAIVVADRNKLKRVLDNLVNNSIKYNKENGSVSLSLNSHDKGVLLMVSDTGSGIKNEDVKSIFDGFYRGDAARSNIKGNGLGLSIARKIAEDHRGKMWVKSQEGVGTEVFLYMPIREAEENAVKIKAKTKEASL